MDENIYQEACTVSPSRIPADKSAPGQNNVEEPSTDDAATGYIPGVGMRNPGQSRVWTSAVKKTISVLSLVLNCCLLGAVIFLAMTVSDLQLSVKQQEQKTGMTTDKLHMDMSDLNLSISQLQAMTQMTNAKMTSELQQAMKDIKGLSGRVKEHEEAVMTESKPTGLQENYRKMHDVLAQRLGKIETSVKDLRAAVPPPTCPHGYQKYRQLCYKVFFSRKTFHDSAAACRADGGDLAMPRVSGIDAFLVSLVKASSGNLRSSIGDQQPERPSRFWFGLSQRHHEGQWEWMDGTALGTGYNGWGEGEPNDGYFPGSVRDQEDCAEYHAAGE
ncbi:PREDICTED: C-type lectin domain family 4 member M-like [Branchiostoma belcheri]|uniref:C-type lectin domain family 4 member M-like n=1 Tax=Branchiostoma belcheri TaxID=7741 RepID=A0A6P5ABE5_BRABE|nr:PREDICTED: C-type lectin domain family 4 member M-like [Branchiostoma belcheri]